MAWLPSLISLLIGILGQFNAADWVANHPNVAMGLGTLGTLITALIKSPFQSSSDAGGMPAAKHFLFGVCLFVGAALASACEPAYALDVKATGAIVNMQYQEPTQNADGTPLSDLAFTSGYWAAMPNGSPMECVQTPASAATGGGTIQAACTVPILAGQEADFSFSVTATDHSGNASTPTPGVIVRLDFLAPASPR